MAYYGETEKLEVRENKRISVDDLIDFLSLYVVGTLVFCALLIVTLFGIKFIKAISVIILYEISPIIVVVLILVSIGYLLGKRRD